MTLEEAVYKLTADIADFHRVDAGRIQLGARADLVVLDPQRLDESVEEIHEAEMPKFGGLKRLVRRNDATVTAVLVNGNLVWTPQGPTGGLGIERGNGRVLAAG
jgi:N-acyl-D-glutamate deacylase